MPPTADAPFVALTSAGFETGPALDMGRVRDFSNGVNALRTSTTGIEGLRGQESFFFPDVLELDAWKVSFWRDDAALRAFAYAGGVHEMQMDRYRELHTADRTSFTRAVALETRGSWHGADPVRVDSRPPR